MRDLRSYFRDLNAHLGELESAVPRLEEALRREMAGAAGPGAEGVAEVRSYLGGLSSHLESLERAVPRLEERLRSGLPPRAVARSGRVNEMRGYLEDLRRRLHGLDHSVPRLEYALDAGAATVQHREALGLNEMRRYLMELRERLRGLEHAVPRLEDALRAGTEEAERSYGYRRPAGARAGQFGARGGADRWRTRVGLAESWLSHRRLRGLVAMAAALVLLAALAAAMYFNPQQQVQAFAESTVTRMRNATSYRGVGVDRTVSGGTGTEVREQFRYVAPDQVWSRFLATGGGGRRRGTTGLSVAAGGSCGDKDIAVLGSSRHQRCNDAGAEGGWRTDSFDPSVFDTPLFQPWMRFAWCTDIDEEGTQEVNGVENRVFSCRVPPEREAAIIWEREEKLPAAQETSRDRFIAEAEVNITIWVRTTDGYIGRFAMDKRKPAKGEGTIRETVDYVYSDFNQIGSIEPPTTGIGRLGAEGRVAILSGHRLQVEVADEQRERSVGLSDRPFLPRDQGLLFVWPQEKERTFWMKGVLFPLDVVFLDSDRRIVDIQTMRPEPDVRDSQLTRYPSREPAQYAIEMNAGLAQEFGLAIGMQVELRERPGG